MSKVSIAKSESRSTVSPGKAPGYSEQAKACSTWKLPSGESLAEFALRFGFLAPRLLGSRIQRHKELSGLREVR
jgi:hypothetical protein